MHETASTDGRSDPGQPRSVSPWRGRLVSSVTLLVCSILILRLYQLQGPDRDKLSDQVSQQRLHYQRILARPGEILDRHGRLLATTVSTRSLFVDPSRIREPWQTARLLATALKLNPDALFERLSRSSNKRFLWVKRRLTDAETQRVRELGLPGEIWGFRDEYLRRYPQGPLAAHVLGLRDIDGTGRGGIEESMDRILRGTDGQRAIERDALGRVVGVRDEIAELPQNGRPVQLTLDAVIQLFAERELDEICSTFQPRSACALVMDPRSGELLAMASRPGFDPNHATRIAAEAWKNHSIASMYEPGSTLKPFLVGWALKSGVLDRDEELDCEQGAYRMGRRVLHDHHPYGWLSVKDILVKSSNIGMAKIGERLTNAGLYEAVQVFGFGRRTGIELAGEIPGMVRPLGEWNSYSTGSVPMGQEIAVTPLQLITAHACLANGGQLISPRLTMSGSHGPELTASLKRPCLPEPIARWLVNAAMREVVERGTGKKAQLPNVAVFGKTGTAQKVDPNTGRYSNSRHISSFVCGAPAHAPRVVVLVVVDEPAAGESQFGGSVAAPGAARILHYALGRVPDQTSRTAVRSPESRKE